MDSELLLCKGLGPDMSTGSSHKYNLSSLPPLTPSSPRSRFSFLFCFWVSLCPPLEPKIQPARRQQERETRQNCPCPALISSGGSSSRNREQGPQQKCTSRVRAQTIFPYQHFTTGGCVLHKDRSSTLNNPPWHQGDPRVTGSAWPWSQQA